MFLMECNVCFAVYVESLMKAVIEKTEEAPLSQLPKTKFAVEPLCTEYLAIKPSKPDQSWSKWQLTLDTFLFSRWTSLNKYCYNEMWTVFIHSVLHSLTSDSEWPLISNGPVLQPVDQHMCHPDLDTPFWWRWLHMKGGLPGSLSPTFPRQTLQAVCRLCIFVSCGKNNELH